MPTFDRIVGVDDGAQLPDEVRETLVENLSSDTEPEGVALTNKIGSEVADQQNVPRLLSDLASRDKMTAFGILRARWDDTPEYSEGWTSLTGWSQSPGSTLAVSAGALFAGATGGQALHALPDSPNGRIRVVAPVQLVANAATGSKIRIGLSTDPASATPDPANVAGILLTWDGQDTISGTVESWIGTGLGGTGAGKTTTGPTVGATTQRFSVSATPFWRAHIEWDGIAVSLVLVDTSAPGGVAGGRERYARIPLTLPAGAQFQSLFVENTDARPTGCRLLPLNARGGLTTARPPAPFTPVGWTETWATAPTAAPWTPYAAPLTVSGGKAYGATSAGAARDLGIGASGTGTVTALLDFGGVSALAHAIAFDNSAPGTVSSALNSLRGFSFLNNDLRWHDAAGTTSVLLAGGVNSGQWQISYTITPTTVYGTVTRLSDGTKYTAQLDRTAIPGSYGLSRLRVVLGSAAANVGPIVLSAKTPNVGPDQAAYPSAVVTVLPTGEKVRWRFPPGYDGRKAYPLVIMSHGASGNADTFSGGGGEPTYGLLGLRLTRDAGCVTVSTEAAPIGSEMGNDAMIVANVRSYLASLDRFPVSCVFLYGGSMGAVSALNTALAQIIPGVVGIMINQPVIGLRAVYDATNLRARVTDAYALGTYPDANFATKTGPSAVAKFGHDPLDDRVPATAFGGIPIWIEHSLDDTTVPSGSHALPFIDKFEDFTPITVYTGTGNHGEPTQFPIDDQIAWVKARIAVAV